MAGFSAEQAPAVGAFLVNPERSLDTSEADGTQFGRSPLPSRGFACTPWQGYCHRTGRFLPLASPRAERYTFLVASPRCSLRMRKQWDFPPSREAEIASTLARNLHTKSIDR